MRRDWSGTNAQGAEVGERYHPFERVGIYVPGGTAPLVSSAIMTVTLAAMGVGALFVLVAGVVPGILNTIGIADVLASVIGLLRWPLLLIIASLAITLLYRYGPSGARAKWRWVTLGSAFAAVAWVVVSLLFSWYLANFADYNATYGSLGAIIGFMVWMWLSVLIIIIGAELDAEIRGSSG